MTPATAFPAPSRAIKQHGQPIIQSRILPIRRLTRHRGSGAYLAPGCGIVRVRGEGRSAVVESTGKFAG
jgi:hypothetical protein